MKKSERARLHFVIIHKICRNLFEKSKPVENLRLGPDYLSRISKLNKMRGDLFNRITGDLSKFEPNELTKNFSTNGTPVLEETKTWAGNYRREVDKSFERLPIWYSAPLFRTKELADFEYWGRSEFLSIDEVVWLSVGLEPTPVFLSSIEPYTERGSRRRLDHIEEHMSRHKETIRRKFAPHNKHELPDIRALVEWIETVELEVHPVFFDMVEKIAARKDLSETDLANQLQATDTSNTQNRRDNRETDSVALLFTALAVDAYGYVPGSQRGPIPKEIQEIAASLGIEISDETIRKYLKLGERFIADDWEPPKP